MPRLTLTRPNRLNLRGLIFDRDVATEVPIDVFRELYDTRKAQFDFSAEGIALMVAASADYPDPDRAPRADASPTEAGPAEAGPQPPKTGLVIRKTRKPRPDEPAAAAEPGLFDQDPAEPTVEPAPVSPTLAEPVEPKSTELGVDV